MVEYVAQQEPCSSYNYTAACAVWRHPDAVLMAVLVHDVADYSHPALSLNRDVEQIAGMYEGNHSVNSQHSATSSV
jgi:hypothetical protein